MAQSSILRKRDISRNFSSNSLILEKDSSPKRILNLANKGKGSIRLRELGMELDQLDGVELYQGKGCKECSGRGFKGRVAVYEILEFDDDIRKAITSSKFSEVMLREVVREKGISNLRQEGLRKVIDGITTIEEVLQKTLVLG